ncbi:MAG TPA: YqgE/AlgH family protein [Gammaproteobacteria bacterium]|nr:YqgE/AlgH family protein [Gammaproteobacteria bacterium]
MKLHLQFAVLTLALAGAGPLAAQPPAVSPGRPSTGKLLVAAPDMKDPNFTKTVVLILHNSADGTIGVVINRPTWVEPQQIEPSLGKLEAYKGKVYRGGPLGASQLVYLVRDPPAGTFTGNQVLDNVFVGGNADQLESLAKKEGSDRLRLYAGHAEWAAGQLEQEIAADQWLLVDGTAQRIFTTTPEVLWQEIAHRGSEVVVDAGHRGRPEAARLMNPRSIRAAGSLAELMLPELAAARHSAPALSPPRL